MHYSKRTHPDIRLQSGQSLTALTKKNAQSVTRDRPAVILLVAVWFGLAVGVAEVCVRGVQVFVLHQWIWLSLDVVWMAPLAIVSLLVAAAFLLLFTRELLPRLISRWTVFFVLNFLSLLGPLLFVPGLQRYAAILLTCGLAAQISRMIIARFDAFYSLVRSTVLPLVITVLVLGLSVIGWRVFETSSAVANLSPASPGAPNVLLIVQDTVRANSLSLYGHTRRTTPKLEELASEGVVFERALTTSPWTLPAHATMFTGRYPHELSTDWLTPLDNTYPTLAEIFSSRGYITAGFVANLLYSTYETGLNRGFAYYEDFPISIGMILKSSWLVRTLADKFLSITGYRKQTVHKTAEEVNDDFMRWLSRKDERPFFVFLNYFDAHVPYISPKPFRAKFGPEKSRPKSSFEQWTSQEIQGELDAYEGSIAYIDDQIGILLAELKRQGLLENTLVIATSDHGEQFGEHGLWDHANSLYRPLLHVPLIISFPGRIPEGMRVAEAVSLRDIPATILHLAGIHQRIPFPGTSLSQFWEGEKSPKVVSPLLAEVRKGINLPPRLPIMKGDMRSLVADGFSYIQNGDGTEELYDFNHDPGEEHNLAADKKYRQVLARFRNYLETIVSKN